MPSATEMKFLGGMLFQGFKIMPISLFFNATSHTARDTEFPLGKFNIAFIDDWPAKSPDLNPIDQLYDNLDKRGPDVALFHSQHHSTKTSLKNIP
jgi:hypothetical protein